MRSLSSSIATFGSASDLSDVDTVFIQSANPVDMQTQVAAAIAAHPNANWVLSHVDLAGGGDGHTFVCTLVFADALIGSGMPPDSTRAFFFMASEASELAVARETVDPQISALFDAPISASSVSLFQTLAAGAAKGTRFMGCVLCTFTQIS